MGQNEVSQSFFSKKLKNEVSQKKTSQNGVYQNIQSITPVIFIRGTDPTEEDEEGTDGGLDGVRLGGRLHRRQLLLRPRVHFNNKCSTVI